MINITQEQHEYYLSRLRTRISSLEGAQREGKLSSQQEDSLAFYRIALAALEAPVFGYVHYKIFDQFNEAVCTGEEKSIEMGFDGDGKHFAVYTAPPVPMKNEWISCRDRLPDKTGYYLTLCHHPQFHERCYVQHVMHFQHTAYATPVMQWYDAERANFITHWMPLPEVPNHERS